MILLYFKSHVLGSPLTLTYKLNRPSDYSLFMLHMSDIYEVFVFNFDITFQIRRSQLSIWTGTLRLW